MSAKSRIKCEHARGRGCSVVLACAGLLAACYVSGCTGTVQSQGSLRVVKKKESEKEKQIRILEKELAESKLSAQAKDEVIRALRETPEVDSPEEQARLLEAAQSGVLRNHPDEVAAVAELLTKSASRLAAEVADDPEARQKLEAELLQRAVDSLVKIGADEGTIVDALVRNTMAFSEGGARTRARGCEPAAGGSSAATGETRTAGGGGWCFFWG